MTVTFLKIIKRMFEQSGIQAQLFGALRYPFLKRAVELFQFVILTHKFCLKALISCLEQACVQAFFDQSPELIIVPGFGQVLMYLAFVYRTNRRLHIGVTSKQESQGIRGFLSNGFKQLSAIGDGHTHVTDDEINVSIFEYIECITDR